MTLSPTRLHVGQGTTRGPLTVFPVWTDTLSLGSAHLTGSDAPVDVAERSDSPAVDQLVVTNRGDRPVLLLAGELLEGGMQHRALTATTLLAPGTPTVLPVLCVEQGRGTAARRTGAAAGGRRCRCSPTSSGPTASTRSGGGSAGSVRWPARPRPSRCWTGWTPPPRSPQACGRCPASAACW